MPVFWKKTQRLFLKIGITLATVWGINVGMSLGMPDWFIDICRYGLVFCAAVAGTSKFATTDQTLSEK